MELLEEPTMNRQSIILYALEIVPRAGDRETRVKRVPKGNAVRMRERGNAHGE